MWEKASAAKKTHPPTSHRRQLPHQPHQQPHLQPGSDLSKICEIFKMVRQRLKLSRVVFDCIIVCLPHRPMRR